MITKWLSRQQQAERYNVHPRTIVRWGNDPAMGMPEEADFNGKPRRREDKLDAWDKTRVVLSASRKREREAATPNEAA
jgi:hypothetical protein